MTIDAVLRTVGRCALNLDSEERLRAILEENLFSKVIPGVDEGVVPAFVGEILLQLCSSLHEKKDGAASVRTAFNAIRLDPEGAMLCPVEAVIAGLEDAAANRQFAYTDAQYLSSLPWNMLSALVPDDVAVSADNLRIEVDSALHEVEEGFVDPGTAYPDIAKSAAILASHLRRCIPPVSG